MLRQRTTHDHYCCRKRRPPQSLHTCTSRTKSPHKMHRSDFAAEKDSSCSSDRRRDFGKDLVGGLFENRMV
jgi:hypothetical protein